MCILDRGPHTANFDLKEQTGTGQNGAFAGPILDPGPYV